MKAWNTVKLGLVLTAYAAAACVGLAFVYGKTKAVIDKQDAIKLEASIKELFPNADGFADITGTFDSPDSGVLFESEYSITQGGKLIGAAVQASANSYGGTIKVLVGVNAAGTINRVKIMSHSDTPGLGANAANENYFVDKSARLTFYGQFSGKQVGDPFEPKNDVIAVTASTITSRAVSRIVRAAGLAASQWLAAEGAEQ
ncbi:MAG: FMN-binding protein [Spirochaetaceae bacterium]|jgi:electron transport complex protein RnfG|nr:FMN-binding protein [Spirochaetaceae bacterium]